MELTSKDILIKSFWEKQRGKYNVGLIVAALIAFIAYIILGSNLIAHAPARLYSMGE